MNHSPTPSDYRSGITAAAHLQQSSTAFSFLQRIQHYYQQQQLSESALENVDDFKAELDSEAFHLVAKCALQTGDCAIVQGTFDAFMAAVGAPHLPQEMWIMLLQVTVQTSDSLVVLHFSKRKSSGTRCKWEPQALRINHCGNGSKCV
jgi:ribulose kinase